MAGPKPRSTTKSVKVVRPTPPRPHVIKTDRVPMGGFANPVKKKNQPVAKTNRGKKAL